MSERFSIQFPVRFRDIDTLGHVNNAVYFTYMESARTEYWMNLFESENLRELSFIVAHAECDFKVAAKFGDEIKVTIRTTSIRNSSFVWEYEILNAKDDAVFATAKTIQVYYDYQQEKSLPVPDDVRSKLLGSNV